MLDEQAHEDLRRAFVAENSAAVESNDLERERTRLQAIHGKDNVWDTNQVQQQFDVKGFAAPFIQVVRKSDGAKGWLEFQHSPRLYFCWRT